MHVLRRDREDLARRFATSGIDRFDGAAWTAGTHGTPLLDGVAARLTARPVGIHPVGDHLLVVGEVLDAHTEGGAPLVHHDGGYGGFDPGTPSATWSPRPSGNTPPPTPTTRPDASCGQRARAPN